MSITASMRSFFWPVANPRASAKKLEHAHRRHFHVQRAAFGQVAEMLTAFDPVLHHVVPGDLCFAFAGGDVAGQHLHRRALAGTIWTRERRPTRPLAPKN